MTISDFFTKKIYKNTNVLFKNRASPANTSLSPIPRLGVLTNGYIVLQKPSVAGKYLAMMAASVAFLALAFIVTIGVGAHVLGNQECETTAVAPAPHPHSTVSSIH